MTNNQYAALSSLIKRIADDLAWPRDASARETVAAVNYVDEVIYVMANDPQNALSVERDALKESFAQSIDREDKLKQEIERLTKEREDANARYYAEHDERCRIQGLLDVDLTVEILALRKQMEILTQQKDGLQEMLDHRDSEIGRLTKERTMTEERLKFQVEANELLLDTVKKQGKQLSALRAQLEGAVNIKQRRDER